MQLFLACKGKFKKGDLQIFQTVLCKLNSTSNQDVLFGLCIILHHSWHLISYIVTDSWSARENQYIELAKVLN